MTSRAAKRARINRSTFTDAISFAQDDFNTIHSSEGIVRNIGGSLRPTRRLQSRHTIEDQWEDLSDWVVPDNQEFGLDPDASLFEETAEAEVMGRDAPSVVPVVAKTKKKRSLVSKHPHVVWKDCHRQTYLDELIRWAGRGDFQRTTLCMDCLAKKVETPQDAEYRCTECLSPDLTCAQCCVKRHRNNPFHRIERWDGRMFVEISLKTIGLKIQLNHSGGHCDNPIPCHAQLLVLHVNGIHSVNVQYCGCTRAIPQHIQLLRRRLYPVSQLSVKTCVTFELLRHLHKLALTTKASTYDFYRCLEKSTTNTGVNVPKSRYRALFRMVLQWRHLHMLKWGGRGHDVSGVAGTSLGELAVKCPTCPYPGLNMREDWENIPENQKFLYQVILCMDANFRLKNQLVSNYSQDPGLGIGWAFMVPREQYEQYVLSRAKDEDVSTCVGFQALAKANTKFSTGLRYTGVGMVSCGRSEMIMPLGVGNLQKGERYANMDYIFAMVLRTLVMALILISYDIACQWFTNLFKRMDYWPKEIKPSQLFNMKPAIPKLHLAMHERTGHHVYSFNYMPGVGQTDGECPERIWSQHNAIGNATKTQGPGSRQDTLDDHFNFWNWSKITSLGTTLVRRYRRAVEDRNTQEEGLRDLNGTLEDGVEAEWEALCKAWEMDQSVPKKAKDPYHSESSGISKAQARKELAESEKKFIEKGGKFPNKTTASMFINDGLELEEAQRRLQRQAQDSLKNSTVRKEGSLTEQRNLLLVSIRDWEELLPVYLPAIVQYKKDHPDADSPASANVEDIKLWLPSRVPSHDRLQVSTPNLVEMEGKLREAQMTDSLSALRQILKLKSRMVQFKNQNVRGQREGTRSRAVIDRVHERARNTAAKYRAARSAYLELVGPGDWESNFRVLNDADIRGFQDPDLIKKRVGRRGIFEDGHEPEEPEQQAAEESEFTLFTQPRGRRDGTGETRRTLSWIWTSKGGDKEDGGDDIARVEWAKIRARTKRAQEEVTMLQEEMRRALAFFRWKSCWWRERATARPGVPQDMQEGISAYAYHQANIQDSLEIHCWSFWKTPLAIVEDEEDDDSDDDDDNEEGIDEIEAIDEGDMDYDG